ncbi:hypothetical protein [Bacillus siamensis]|uniref:hypothetical protein n=1 Tax=Bacillus siamensis TaxID=659243 RepID=UPI002E1DBE78|nr:hypothetical protein [Bacillus siamensis]MED0780778.1 hypothetical protein [Bacillus siamensis]MED0833597.1 hypothetical protein [Bacillus siamensis]
MVVGENIMHVLYYDENFMYAGEDFIEGDDLPPNSTTAVPDPTIILPKYDPKKNKWTESATEEYKDSVKPSIPEPNDFEIIGQTLSQLRLSLLQVNKTINTMLKDIADLKGGS